MRSLVVLGLITLTMQSFGQEEEWIRVDTLQIASSPVFVNRLNQDTLVIVPIGLYTELKYGTEYASNCIQENLELNKAVIKEEVFRSQYEGLYHQSRLEFRSSQELNNIITDELKQCSLNNANANVVILELEEKVRGRSKALFVAIVVAVVEFVVIILR
jgi:hypothetical protein